MLDVDILMAKKMKDYNVFRCPYCSCEYFDEGAGKGKTVGNPVISCPNCGKSILRKSVLEPALIRGSRYFDIRFASLYRKLKYGVIFIYAVFLLLIVMKADLLLSLYLIGMALLIYIAYEIIRVVHMRSFLKSDEYYSEIAFSLNRLSDKKYAEMITEIQGIDSSSVYFYELYSSKQ